jgi:hypothetical protein
MHWKREIELLTPTFCRGAYQKETPELRAPSIRGVVRWWFRALGGSPDEEKAAFGGMKKFGRALAGQVVASHLVFRVLELNAVKAAPDPATLPHKPGGQSSPQPAFAPGGSFQLEVFSRYNSLPPDLTKKVESALEVWTLLGSLGLRANRAGGSLWPVGEAAPQTPPDLRKRLDAAGCTWPVYLAGEEVGQELPALRAAATDTLQRLPHLFGATGLGQRDLEQIQKFSPALVTGPFHPKDWRRLASPLKLKVVRLGGKLRLLITAPEERIIAEARRALAGHRSKPETWAKIIP